MAFAPRTAIRRWAGAGTSVDRHPAGRPVHHEPLLGGNLERMLADSELTTFMEKDVDPAGFPKVASVAFCTVRTPGPATTAGR